MRPESKLEKGGRAQITPRRGSALSRGHGEPWRVRQGWDRTRLGSQTPLAAGSNSEQAGRPARWLCPKRRRVERRERVPVGPGGRPG